MDKPCSARVVRPHDKAVPFRRWETVYCHLPADHGGRFHIGVASFTNRYTWLNKQLEQQTL